LLPEHHSIFGLDPFFTLTATHPLESDNIASLNAGESRASLLPTMSFGDQPFIIPNHSSAAMFIDDDDDLQQEVTREMQEAIEKDMESINAAAVPTVGGI
jgi:hypothetical protein